MANLLAIQNYFNNRHKMFIVNSAIDAIVVMDAIYCGIAATQMSRNCSTGGLVLTEVGSQVPDRMSDITRLAS